MRHPNVVSVFDIGSDDGVYWIVSELVDGDSLYGLMSKGPVPLRRAIDIAAQIAGGLAAAHAGGIIHRDLKPGNIMLDCNGNVKIVDFGLAKRVIPNAASGVLTEEGVILGTAGYMSPEQVRGEAADPRSDIFSFGVILYELLAGKAAFEGTSPVELMHEILNDETAELPSKIPPSLNCIVRRCLEKDPPHRFQSAADLEFSLVTLRDSPASDGSGWDDKPRFSPDGKLLFFVSVRDGYRCIWAQHLGRDMRPDGKPFVVDHSHRVRRSLQNSPFGDQDIAVGPGMILFHQAALTGNIWLLDPEAKDDRQQEQGK